MTGPEHYQRAEQLAEMAAHPHSADRPEATATLAAIAVVHAKLAHTAAIMEVELAAGSLDAAGPAPDAWRNAIGWPS